MNRKLRPVWADNMYVVGNPLSVHYECPTVSLEEWESEMPCDNGSCPHETRRCHYNGPCTSYNEWLSKSPLKRKESYTLLMEEQTETKPNCFKLFSWCSEWDRKKCECSEQCKYLEQPRRLLRPIRKEKPRGKGKKNALDKTY